MCSLCCGLLAKWLRVRVRGRGRVRAGANPTTYTRFALQSASVGLAQARPNNCVTILPVLIQRMWSL